MAQSQPFLRKHDEPSPSQSAARPASARSHGAQPVPSPPHVPGAPAATPDACVPTLILMVGLPAAGKTTRAKELALRHPAIRLTPDDWMIPLFGDSMAEGKRWVLEGRLISVALQALRLGTSVILDYGLWGRDERSALRWLAAAAGAASSTVYIPIDRDIQHARVAHRQATRPHETFQISEAELDEWRAQFEVPDDAELRGEEIPSPPVGYESWLEWIIEHWPSAIES